MRLFARPSLITTSQCCIALCCMLSISVFAQTDAYQQLQSQRTDYQALIKRIRTTPVRQLDTLVDDIQAMRDYPLFPYLYYELVNRNLTYSNRKQINAFLRDVKEVPIRNRLLKKWLVYLAKNNYKTVFLKTYEGGLGTDLLCRNLHIKRVKNQLDEAWYQQVEVIWLSGYSLPDACDPVLAYWRQQGKLKPALAIARMSLAGESGQRSLSRYLKRYAPKESHYIADLWNQVRRNPVTTLKPERFPFHYPQYDSAIVKWGLNKMSWRDPQRVIKALPKWQNSGKLSANDIQSIKETLAISLTLDNSPQAREWLMRAASPTASQSLWRWYLMHAVKAQQWSKVVDIVKTAPQAYRSSSEFSYWYAKALLHTKQIDQSQQQFGLLAKQRHYYGFLAAAHIDAEPNLSPQSLQVEAASTQFVQKHPQALRARELFFLDELVSARREWFALMKTLSPSQQRAAVRVAYSWNWYDQAIVGALKVGAKNDLAIRFPTAFMHEFEQQASHYNIQPSYAMAIARRESSFMEDAVSSANARGIMQLLPDTARYLISLNGVLRPAFQRHMAHSSINRELVKAESNIEFGVGFLRYLQQKLGNDQVLVAAAYNAGWRKVERWLPKNQSIPADIWIDSIPFKETREYVKAILTYQLIYEWHRKQPLQQFKVLAAKQISPLTP